MDVRSTSGTVEIFYQGKRVASHLRSRLAHKATTDAGHRPKSHQHYLEWTPTRIIQWAGKVGPFTARLVEGILTSKPHPEMGYRSALGVIRLERKYGAERLEAASTRAVRLKLYRFQSVKSMLKSGQDREPLPELVPIPFPVQHENLRGPDYYASVGDASGGGPMLNQATLDKLAALKLTGMAAAYEKQLEEPEARGLSFEERFGMLVDSHWTWRENQALARRLKKSKLSAEPCVEDINYRYPRKMDAATMRGLTSSQWVTNTSASCSSGRPGSASRGWRRRWRRRPAAMATACCTGPRPSCSATWQRRGPMALGRLLDRIARTDVLLVDDFAMAR